MSTRRLLLVALAASLTATPLSAQAAPPDFRGEFLGQFDGSMSKLLALAEAMPPASYAWSPGEGVMPVGRVYAHIARYNYGYLANNLGIAAPAGLDVANLETEVTGKQEVVDLLRRSGEHVRQHVRAMPESRLAERTRLYGNEVAGWAVLLQLLAHMNEHVGQSIAYARMNDVVPPWSR